MKKNNFLKLTSIFITGTMSYSYQINNNSSTTSNNMNVIKDKVILITNPDILITKDILRSEVLNELNYKLKENQLLRKQKEEELKYKKLFLSEKELETKYKIDELKKEQLNTKLLNEKFSQLKIQKRISYLDEYPFTTLSFKPEEIDLVNNIIKSNIEEEKIKKIKLLKKVNENNLGILKTQYLLLKEFEKNFSNLYYNIEYVNDYNMALKTFENIEIIIVQLLQTNILYMQEDFSTFRIKLIKLKNLISKLIIEKEKGNVKKTKEIKTKILNEYNDILKQYYKIRNSLLSNIIKLQQINQNEFKLIELINFQNSKNKNVLKKLIRMNIKTAKSKPKPKKEINIRIKKEDKKRILLNYKKKLAAELNVPLYYLKFLTYEDVSKVRIIETKINFYKKIILRLETKSITKKEIKKIAKLLKVNDTEPIILENKVLDIITKLIQEKYNIIKKRINEYKKEEIKRKEKLRKLRLLMKKKKELERRRKLLEERKRKEKLEEERIKRMKQELILRKERMEQQKKLAKLKKIAQLKRELKKDVKKYIYIGELNNQLILENQETNEIVYVKPGTVLEGHDRILSVDIKNKKLIILNEEKKKKFIYDIKKRKLKLLEQ